METTPFRWKAVAGFLVMNLLITVTSSLTCHQFTNYTQAGLPGYFGVFSALNSDPSNRTAIKCLSSHNACVSIRLELSTVSHALFMDHRDCATTKYPNGGKESSKKGDKYFAIKYKATYCSSDLCNGEMPSVHPHNETTLVKEKCKPSSSKKCYAGINYHESETGLEPVTCRSDSDYCYQGSGHIKAANNALHLRVRSCRSICHIPQQQIFGPIEISLKGSCCSGNLCNKKENADPTPTAQAWETTSELYGHGTVNQTGNFTNLGHGYGLFRDFECEDYIVDNGTEWSFIDPGAQGAVSPFTDHGAQGPASPFIDRGAQGPPNSKGSTLQLRPLLLTLVVTVLALSW
ncbi:ly6/PLAUR domain-containing protein 5-like isoform X3 [Anolis sagrei]